MSNPLRLPKPDKAESILVERVSFADEYAVYQPNASAHLHLTATELWLTKELAIPIWAVRGVALVRKGWLIPRHALLIEFLNPITGGMEGVHLCKMDFLGAGIYRRAPLERLADAIETARMEVGDTEVRVQEAEAPERVCEKCGREPAEYVGYWVAVGLLLIWYRTAVMRRIHCRRHVALFGAGAYLVTAGTSWIGIGILAYPFLVFQSALTLRSAIGPFAYVLGVVPTLGVGALLWTWFS